MLFLNAGSEQLGSYQASERDLETSSDVTLQSHDTWGGLAPPVAPHPQLSDEVIQTIIYGPII